MAGSKQEDSDKLESYLRVHLKKDELELTPDQQIEALHKRERAKWWHLFINLAAIIIFGYSFYAGITQLSQTFLIIIIAVFGVNVGLIFYQKKQIKELIAYVGGKREESH